ncbi:PilW family protein [Cupriavidus sp. NPDC089707]|uniref:PilW family protein n=1 Tax=Cupriavidus sp. NPDC089707 TaxID=3363963 RepID=UPI0037FCA6F3
MRTLPMRRNASGFSLTEAMVGLALGLIVAAVAAAAWQVALSAYRSAAERVLLEERGQRALAILAAVLRQAGWHPGPLDAAVPPAVSGADDCGQPGIAEMPTCARRGVAQSDALLVRFSGQGQPGDPSQPDETMLDCSGYPLAARVAGAESATDFVAANLLYIAAAVDGEPQLLCRYPSRHNGQVDGHGWTSGALVRGVASLQLRYGVDIDGDGQPDAFLPAARIQAMGAQAWHRVLAVQIALALQGEQRGAAGGAAGVARADDALADLQAAPVDTKRANRRVFATTVRLRNAPRCEETLC